MRLLFFRRQRQRLNELTHTGEKKKKKGPIESMNALAPVCHPSRRKKNPATEIDTNLKHFSTFRSTRDRGAVGFESVWLFSRRSKINKYGKSCIPSSFLLDFMHFSLVYNRKLVRDDLDTFGSSRAIIAFSDSTVKAQS